MPTKKNTVEPSQVSGQKKPGRSGRQPRAITEGNRAVEPSQATEDKFKYIFDHSAVGNSVTLPSGEISVNQALCEMLGFSQDELKNCKWQEITHPDDVELTQNEIDALISGKKETVRFTKRYINKAGAVVWADVGSALRRDKDGRPLYFISTVMDITEHKLAEAALQEARTLQNVIVESTSDMIWSVDPVNFGLLTFNHGLYDYFMKERGMQIKLGDRPEELFPDADFVDRWHSMYHRALREAASYSVEYQVFAGTRTLELTFNLLMRENKPFGISVFGKDITERKQAERELIKSQARYQQLFDNSGTGVIIVDENGQYLLVNKINAQKFGTTPEQVVGKSMADFLAPDQAAHYQAWNSQLLLSGGHREYEDTFKLPVGERTFLIIDQCLQDENGRNFAVQSSSIDITERKQAEAGLQASEQKLRTLFDTMTEGVALNQVIYDEKGEMVDYRILEVNEAFYQVADYQPGQVVGNLATRLYGMSPETIRAFWEAHKNATEPAHTEFVSPLNKRVYYISASPFQNDTFVTSFTDITALKQVERALKQSEEKFRLLSEKSGTGIYIIQDAKIVYVNPKLVEMFGYPPEEIIGKPIPKELIHPNNLQAVMGRLQQRLDGVGENDSVIFKAFKKDGSLLQVEVYGMSIEYQGRPAVTGTVMDVTRRKQAEAALQRSEERLREVLENSLDASYKRDIKTNTYEYISPVITRLSGHTPDELKSLPLENVLELIHPDDRPEVDRLINAGLSGAPGTAWQVEYRIKNKQGQYCWFQDRFSVMRDSGGKPLAIIGSVSEITERKQTEEALLQKVDELERFQRLTVRRELRMIEMKKEINALLVQAGLPPKYVDPSENGEIHLNRT